MLREENGRRRASFSGLQHCGLPWECPVCSGRVRAERAAELAACATWARNEVAQGDAVAMLTLTVRHHRGDDLRSLVRALGKAWSLFHSGAPGKRWAKRVGLLGYARVLEVTHGEANGWHPHLHVALFVRHPDQLRAERHWILARWREVVGAKVPQARPNGHGATLTFPRDPGDYVCKIGIEMTARDKPGRRTPFQLLLLAGRGGARSADLWRDYSSGIEGARLVTWSRKLRQLAGLGAERTDAEIANEPDAGRHLLEVTGQEWDSLLRRDYRAQLLLLECAEQDGEAGIMRALCQLQRSPPPRPPP